jgi:predicted ArsR family transcriptional regulator
MTQADLFSYPYTAGYKEPTTSRENAERIEKSGKAETLRQRVLSCFQASGAIATADEIAAFLGEHILAIRPRLSELRAKGLIEPTGERRQSSCGGTAHVWKAAR